MPLQHCRGPGRAQGHGNDRARPRRQNAGAVQGAGAGVPPASRAAAEARRGVLECSGSERARSVAKGRHAPCVVQIAVPIVESMAANIITDLYLQSQK